MSQYISVGIIVFTIELITVFSLFHKTSHSLSLNLYTVFSVFFTVFVTLVLIHYTECLFALHFHWETPSRLVPCSASPAWWFLSSFCGCHHEGWTPTAAGVECLLLILKVHLCSPWFISYSPVIHLFFALTGFVMVCFSHDNCPSKTVSVPSFLCFFCVNLFMLIINAVITSHVQ